MPVAGVRPGEITTVIHVGGDPVGITAGRLAGGGPGGGASP